MRSTIAKSDLLVVLLRGDRKAAEILELIQCCPISASSEMALPFGWQMLGQAGVSEISVYLIFSPPFTLDFSLLYVHKPPRQLISALWPLLIGLRERKAAPAGEITHTCYFELSCHFPSPCLQRLQAPSSEPGLLYFHCQPQQQQEGPQALCVVVLPLTSLGTREATKRYAISPPLLLPCEKAKVIFREGNTIKRGWKHKGIDNPYSTYAKLLLTALICILVAHPLHTKASGRND